MMKTERLAAVAEMVDAFELRVGAAELLLEQQVGDLLAADGLDRDAQLDAIEDHVRIVCGRSREELSADLRQRLAAALTTSADV